MKKLLLLAVAAVAMSPMASAITASCSVISGTVLTSTLGGLGYSIANGIGTSTGGATGTITCPSVSVGTGTIANYQVIAVVDYEGGPANTTSGTSVSEVLTLVGGALNGASMTAIISGGTSSAGVVPPVPFQIGSTLSGGTSYAAFTVNVNSSVISGGPVKNSTGQVVISYDQIVTPPPSSVPEPSTYALMGAGLAGMGFIARRRKQ